MAEQSKNANKEYTESELNKVLHQMKVLEKKYDQLSMSFDRPQCSLKSKSNYLVQYIRKGQLPDNFHRKSISENDENIGAILEKETSKEIVNSLKVLSPLRDIASVENISGNYLDVIYQEKDFGCNWASKEENKVESTDVAVIKTIKIILHDLYACPQASQNLINDSCIDIERWMIDQLSHSFAARENEAFFRGNGESQPMGIFTKLNSEELKKDALIPFEAKGEVTLNDLIKLRHSLDNRYQANAVFLLNKYTLQKIRSIKDDDGRFVWQPKLTPSSYDTVIGIPTVCCDDMPAISEEIGDPKILIGDFNAAYKIVDHENVSLMRDPYSNKPYISFYSLKRVGGDLVDPKGVKGLFDSE